MILGRKNHFSGKWFFSGEDGIRTHAPVKTNGFQDRPVMTTSVPLHTIKLSVSSTACLQYHAKNTLSTHFQKNI